MAARSKNINSSHKIVVDPKMRSLAADIGLLDCCLNLTPLDIYNIAVAGGSALRLWQLN